jgi:hypothetical protein
MNLEDIAKMFLVSTRFNKLIKKWPAIFLNKDSNICRINLDIYKQPPAVLDRFFMIFGDFIHTLVLDDIRMYVAIKIVGFSPGLRKLIIKSVQDVWAVNFIIEHMPELTIN